MWDSIHRNPISTLQQFVERAEKYMKLDDAMKKIDKGVNPSSSNPPKMAMVAEMSLTARNAETAELTVIMIRGPSSDLTKSQNMNPSSQTTLLSKPAERRNT